MRKNVTYTMPLKRRRDGKTDYRGRLELLKSGKPRLVARVQSRQVVAQVVKYCPAGDQVVASASSIGLKKMGWKHSTGSAPAAYLTGMICGYRAKKAGVGEAVFDLGLHTPVRGSNVFAVLKGALDAGMNIPHSESCFPSEDRVSGKLIAEYRKDDSLPKDFDEMKKRLAQELGK